MSETMEGVLEEVVAGRCVPKRAVRILVHDFGSPLDKALVVVAQCVQWHNEQTSKNLKEKQ